MPDYLPEDIRRDQNENAVRLVPNEGEVGYFLAVTGLFPFSYAFRQPPDPEIPRFPGSPDGELTAPIDSLVRNTDDHTVWINTDGDTAWTLVGGAAGDSFDYLEAEDDGTNTGLTTDTEATIGFAVVGANTSGTDIFIDGSNDIVINADGLYAASFFLHTESEAPGDTFSYLYGHLKMDRAVRGEVNLWDYRVPVPFGAGHYSQMSFSWTGFMHANDKFILRTLMFGGGADTWTCDGFASVQRIA